MERKRNPAAIRSALVWTAVLVALLSLPSWRGLGPASAPLHAQGVVSVAIDDLSFDAFPEVRTRVTVRNENGVPIVGLGPDKFEIVEDGRASFPPSEVAAQVNPEAVVSVVLVIDVSGSMKGKPVEAAISAANRLLDQLSASDRVAIIAFADEVNVDPAQLAEGRELGFTTDKNAVRNVVNFLGSRIGWDTPLYDAIYKGVKMVSTEPVGKRAVIVMTDGIDERDNAQGVPVRDAGSLSSPDDPINEANRHNIPIFPIGLGSKIDGKYLGRVAERTGGVYQQTPEPDDLTPLFENVLNQLKEQYTLTYNSTLPQDSSYHSLLVRVQLPQGQAYGETKFQFVAGKPLEEAASAPEASQEPAFATAEPAPVIIQPATDAVAQAAATAPPAAAITPEAEASGFAGLVDTLRDTVQEQPFVAAAIGGGLLLLLILIAALLIVLRRGRASDEEEFQPGLEAEGYGPPSDWLAESRPGFGEGATARGAPPAAATVGGAAKVPTAGWPEELGESATAMAPFPGSSLAGQVPLDAHRGAEAGGSTRIVERGPRHLAMLVGKRQTDQKYDLKGTVNIGRAPQNQIVLNDPTISREHAWIRAEGEEFLVFDIGSANGTFVNGIRVVEPTRLQNGDLLRFGELEFVFTKVF